MFDEQELIGQSIGDYRLLRLLGRGTFGTVYLAEHLHDHTYAAVKVLRIPLTGQDALHTFLNEARTIRLRHPHIVPILDFGLSRRDDLPYLVMVYADGGTLRDRHPNGSKLSYEVIDTYMQQLASALQYAHDQRIVHRDVKPENMLISGDGTVQLSDFGIAKISELASLASLNKVAGTPAYAAPEQIRGKPGPASDQYALAIVAYEWLTGQRPFQGDPLAVTVHHLIDVPPSLRSIRPSVSLQVEQVIFKALAKAPEDRFPTITHFAEALHIALQGTISTQVLPNLASSSPIVFISSPSVPPSQIIPSGEHLALTETSLPPELAPTSLPSVDTYDAGPIEILQSSRPAPDLQKKSSKNRRRRVQIVLLCLVLLLGGSSVTWLVAAQMPKLLSITEIPRHITSQTPNYPNLLTRPNVWPDLFDNSDGSCNPLGVGGYQVTLKIPDYTFYKCPGKVSFANFALEVQMHFLSGKEGGILFHAIPQSPVDHFYYVYIRSDTSWGLLKDTLGSTKPTDLGSGQKPEAVKPDLNTLFIVVSNDNIYLYVNGVFLDQIHDKTYSQGKLCLAAGGGQAYGSKSEVVFSHMKVWLDPSLVKGA